MKKFLKILSIVACVSLSISFTGFKGFAHTHGGYSHESTVNLTMNNWMSGLSDELTINEVSIPGTGNSMSYGNHTDFTLTQSMDLETQLNSGIRFLDLSINQVGDDTLNVVMGLTELGYTLVDVVNEVKNFLTQNNNEFVIIKVTEKGSEYGNFGYALKNSLQNNGLSDIIFDGTTSRNPKLKDVRGKIIILSDYDGNKWKSIPYRDNAYIQDDNHLNTNWDLYSKWEKVKKQLHDANKIRNKNKRYINYLTGGGGSFPYFVASGHSSSGTDAPRLSTGLTEPAFGGYYKDFPRVNRFGVFSTIAFEGTNVLTLNEIVRNELGFVGIIVADFPGSGLIREVINSNFNRTQSHGSGSSGSNGSSNNSSNESSSNNGGFGFTYKSGYVNSNNKPSSNLWSN